MSDTLAGTLTLRHSDGTITIGSALPFKGQGHTAEDAFTVDELVVNGEVISQAASKPMRPLSLEVVFAGADAHSFTYPDPLAVATIAGLMPDAINGTYNYLGCTITGAEGANLKATVKLGKPAAGALTPI